MSNLRLLNFIIAVIFVGGLITQAADAYDSHIDIMISQIDEANIYQTTYDLQNFSTRAYPSPGNTQAASYLYDRLTSIPGLQTEYQGTKNNIVSTLPGKNTSSDMIFIIGAHYDSFYGGATDNGCGVATVLELARIMSQYEFNNTIKFAFWNAEETGAEGSKDFVTDAVNNSLNIPLYINFDSSNYDPDNQYVLDVIYNEESEPFAELLTQYNSLYNINFTLTDNVHTYYGDHRRFWEYDYPAIMTFGSSRAPQVHTQNDTIDLVSLNFSKKNGQLGMAILAGLAQDPNITPTAAFTANVTSGATPLAVNFTERSMGTTPLTYAWDFNYDGEVDSTLKSPAFTYTTPGTYTVNLTVTGPGGSVSKIKTRYIAVGVTPVAQFTANTTSGTAPLTVQFTNQSTGTITSHAWDFNNDGSTDSTTPDPVFTYTAPGTYTVNLTVTGPGGSDSDVKTDYITVGVAPAVAQFTVNTNSGTVPLAVLFTDTSTGSAPAMWNWSFGDDSWYNTTLPSERNPTHIYTTAGTYTAYLTVSNPGNTATSAHRMITVTTKAMMTKMGVFRGNHTWYLDYDGNGTWDGTPTDRIMGLGQPGDIMVTGDWNGDNSTEIGVVRGSHTWYLDYNGNGTWDGTPTDRIMGLGQPGDMPMTGKW